MHVCVCVSIRETHQTQSALPTSSARARSHSSLTLTTSSWAVRSSPPPHAHSVPVSRHHRHRTTPHAFACRAHLLYRPCCYGDDNTRSGSAFAELRARVSKSRRGVGKVGGVYFIDVAPAIKYTDIRARARSLFADPGCCNYVLKLMQNQKIG